MLRDVTLVLGGARSGKSRRALALLPRHACERRVFVATAEPSDDEMRERILRHREERGADWELVEAPVDIAAPIAGAGGEGVLVDCLTLWLSNLMHRGASVEDETARLLDALFAGEGSVVLVSNELGLGLVPETPLGRAFRDEQGRLNQRLAAACGRVEFVVAGLSMVVKGG